MEIYVGQRSIYMTTTIYFKLKSKTYICGNDSAAISALSSASSCVKWDFGNGLCHVVVKTFIRQVYRVTSNIDL